MVDLNAPSELGVNEGFLEWDIRKPLKSMPFVLDFYCVLHHMAAVHFDFQTDFYETNVKVLRMYRGFEVL